MRHPSALALLLLLSLGCDGKNDPASVEAPKPQAVTSAAEGTKSLSPDAKGSETKAPDKKAKKKPPPKAPRAKDRKTFKAELAVVDRELEGAKKLATNAPKIRTHQERIASVFIQRARLTGSYNDYANAEAALERAFELSAASSTFMLRAKLHYTLHRLPEAKKDFEEAKKTVRPTPDATSGMKTFEANFALQAGDSATAAKRFDEAVAVKRTMSNLSASAVYQWKTGNFDKAEELFREALTLYHAKAMEPRAWIHLNLGLLDLDRGRYDDALAHYRDAEGFLKGYWLLDEHIAEILTLQGKTDEAKALYLDIIARTNNPEFMDAMAGIAFESGDEAGGREWVAKARKRYEEQTAKYPEAAYGHALGHYLEFGDDPAFVLELARKNYNLRPNLDASIMLAQAHLKAGDAKAAEKALSKILKSKFKSAELFVTAAEVQSQLGNAKKAGIFIDKAKAIDPTSSLDTVPAEKPE